MKFTRMLYLYKLEQNVQLAFFNVSLDNSTKSIKLPVCRKQVYEINRKTWLQLNRKPIIFKICNNSRLLKLEFQIITNLLKKNSYSIICNITLKFINKQHEMDKNLNKSNQSCKRCSFKSSNIQINMFLNCNV